MAGMIIVRGEIDEVPEVRPPKSRSWCSRRSSWATTSDVLDPIPDPSKTEAFFPRTQILYPINGVLNPTITMYPGEVQRWRILNAAEGKFMSCAWRSRPPRPGLGRPHPGRPRARRPVLLSAGNRVEVLVKAGAAGRYDLDPDARAQSRTSRACRASPSADATTSSMLPAELGDPADRHDRGRRASGPEMALPTSLPAWDPPILPIARRRGVSYTVERDRDRVPRLRRRRHPVRPERTPYQVKLGTAEEWTLVNGVDNKLADHAHVFHIHVNPFKITKINGRRSTRRCGATRSC